MARGVSTYERIVGVVTWLRNQDDRFFATMVIFELRVDNLLLTLALRGVVDVGSPYSDRVRRIYIPRALRWNVITYPARRLALSLPAPRGPSRVYNRRRDACSPATTSFASRGFASTLKENQTMPMSLRPTRAAPELRNAVLAASSSFSLLGPTCFKASGSLGRSLLDLNRPTLEQMMIR